jgi:hypothetical protein
MLYAEICPKVRRHNARPGRGVDSQRNISLYLPEVPTQIQNIGILCVQILPNNCDNNSIRTGLERSKFRSITNNNYRLIFLCESIRAWLSTIFRTDQDNSWIKELGTAVPCGCNVNI